VVKVGLDTSFFVVLYRKDEKAKNVWVKIVEREYLGVISMLSIFELRRLSLRGLIGKDFCDALFQAFRDGVCEVRDLNWKTLEEAAYISWGTGLPAADSIIYACCRDCKEFYTADSDFMKIQKKKPKIVFL